MTGSFHKILGFALSLLVVSTGVGVAGSRGIDRAVGQMVLCTGDGPVTVYMDAEGQPTKAPHFCPDFALALLGAVLPELVQVSNPAHSAGAIPLVRRESLISALVLRTPARGPPAMFPDATS